MTVLQLLDEVPSPSAAPPVGDWYWSLAHSIEQSPESWVACVDRIGELSDEHAWTLLSWVETAASQVVRSRSRATLVTAAFAMSLVLQSRLDRRDCSLVASLLRRAADLCGMDFPSSAVDGCERAGAKGPRALRILLTAQASTPATHMEVGNGETFIFARRSAGFDVEDLERWLDDDNP